MNNMYEEVTNQIISMLEQGQIPWRKPWAGSSAGAISHNTGKPYSLLNQLLLQIPGEYITFNQVRIEGGRVKKGAKAKHVYFWKQLVKELKGEDGRPVLKADGSPQMTTIPILKSFSVFHLDDCEGIKARWTEGLPATPAQPVEDAEAVLLDYITPGRKFSFLFV